MVEINGWFIVLVLNFLLIVLLLNELLFKPILGVFEQRQNIRESSLKEASDLEQRKNTALREMDEALAEASRKANETFTNLRQEGLKLQHDYIQDTQDESVKRLYHALRQISAEAEHAKELIRGELDGYSDEIAQKLMHRS